MNVQDKKALSDYRDDLAATAEQACFDHAEDARRMWAQANGNDSGFDPYWNLED